MISGLDGEHNSNLLPDEKPDMLTLYILERDIEIGKQYNSIEELMIDFPSDELKSISEVKETEFAGFTIYTRSKHSWKTMLGFLCPSEDKIILGKPLSKYIDAISLLAGNERHEYSCSSCGSFLGEYIHITY